MINRKIIFYTYVENFSINLLTPTLQTRFTLLLENILKLNIEALFSKGYCFTQNPNRANYKMLWN